MKIERVYAIYFSPTGTTEKIVKTISGELVRLFEMNTRLKQPAAQPQAKNTAQSHKKNAIQSQTQDPIKTVNQSINQEIKSSIYDFTLPFMRNSFPKLNLSDLVIFGMPTYAGRLPNLLLSYLSNICGNDAIAVPIVTFGNRAFDNSLIELRNILELHNFHTIAAGAFACEHSFSYKLGAGRPDLEDLKIAKEFANSIYDKLSAFDEICQPLQPIKVDGDEKAEYYKPQDRHGSFIDIRKVKPLTNDKCIKCGLCAASCPMGAIDMKNFSNVTGKCIKCCSCYKRCPVNAKYFDDKGYLYHKCELEALYGSRRAENRIFI